VNSAIPFYLTRHLSRRLANTEDQYDTAKIGLGAMLFSIFWLVQTALVYLNLGGYAAIFYTLSLPPTAAVALTLRRERRRIRENIAVFFLFLRKRDLRVYLESKRAELEHELADVIRHARRAASDA
jgi:drug/metabolite transporter (DMT)-like permease